MFLTNRIHAYDIPPVTPVDEPRDLRSLFARQPVDHLAPGQTLFFEGDDAKHVFDVLEGTLRIFKIISDGRRIIMGFLNAGDMVGLTLNDTYLYSAEAITPTTVRRLGRRAFDMAVATSEELRPQMISRVCDEMAAAQDQMVLLSCKSAEERLCTFLLKQVRRSMAGGAAQQVVDLPMTRLDMADYLGLTIETVSRTITKLASKGVIGEVGRHSLRIIKPMMLAELAGDGDEYQGVDRRDSVAQGSRRRH